MELVENQVFDSATITVDGRSFVRCTLVNCELRYSGGEFEMVHTMVSDCRWAFGGAARRTMEVLDTFDVEGERETEAAQNRGLALSSLVN